MLDVIARMSLMGTRKETVMKKILTIMSAQAIMRVSVLKNWMRVAVLWVR